MIRILILAIVSLISLSAHSAPPAASEAQATSAPAAEAQAVDPAVENAAQVMQAYMSQVSTLGMDGQSVYDVSLLSNSKSDIRDALLTLINVTDDEETKSNYQTGIVILAFFQPDVGATPISLEEMGPGDKTWRQVVEAEMQSQ